MKTASRGRERAAGRKAATSTLWQAIEPFIASGLKHVLCTDIERDGALTGPNIDLYRDAVARFPQLDWQASGGVRDAADLAALAAVGRRRRGERQGIA